MVIVLVLVLLLGAQVHSRAERQREAPLPRPNILVVLADDLGQGDLGCYNPSSKIPTPHLDALAREGLRFKDAHSPSAVCTPTRYALLTGRYAWRSRLESGVLWGRSRLLIEPGRATIASKLQAAGYRTAVFGKWHLGLGRFDPAQEDLPVDYSLPLDAGPHTVGFERSLIIPASLDMDPYLWVRDGDVVEQPTATTPGSQRRWSGGGGFWRKGPMAPSFDFEGVQPTIVDAAVSFLRELPRGKAARPFFCYVPLAAPHTPWVPRDEYQGKSSAGWYGDFVHQVDAGVGRILQALEASGRAKNTLVIVSSDNGSHWREKDEKTFGHLANLHWRGMKADAWEGGHRVPLLVRWPGVTEAGAATDALVSLVDLFATCAASAGEPIALAEAEDSHSFASVLHGQSPAARDELVCHALDGTFVLRQGPWKLIQGLGSRGFSAPRSPKPSKGGARGQLYHLVRDPGETQNLWLAEPERVRSMQARLAELRAAGRSR
jgi:arylsulfatase A